MILAGFGVLGHKIYLYKKNTIFAVHGLVRLFANPTDIKPNNMKKSILIIVSLTFAVVSQADNNWQKRLPDAAYIAMVSIPGSHDSGTGNGFPTSLYGSFGDQYARTQDISLAEQWNLGVRAFDLRPAIQEGYINVNHGIVPTNLRLDEALYFLRDKLIENPSEFAIVHLLHASDGDNNASDYGERLLELLNRTDLKGFFVDFKSTLTVGEMRGKILLLSRNQYVDQPIGGFIKNWTSQIDWSKQTNGQIVGPSGTTAKLYMQDFYETHPEGDLDRKVAAIGQLLDFSTNQPINSAADIVWVYNFASGYSKTSRLTILSYIDEDVSTSDGYRDNAAHTNAAIIDYLSDPSHTAGPTGIILADYVGVNTSNGYNTRGQDLIKAIIDNNFRYLQDMQTALDEVPASLPQPIQFFTIEGKSVSQPQQRGVYIVQGSDGKFYKILR